MLARRGLLLPAAAGAAAAACASRSQGGGPHISASGWSAAPLPRTLALLEAVGCIRRLLTLGMVAPGLQVELPRATLGYCTTGEGVAASGSSGCSAAAAALCARFRSLRAAARASSFLWLGPLLAALRPAAAAAAAAAVAALTLALVGKGVCPGLLPPCSFWPSVKRAEPGALRPAGPAQQTSGSSSLVQFAVVHHAGAAAGADAVAACRSWLGVHGSVCTSRSRACQECAAGLKACSGMQVAAEGFTCGGLGWRGSLGAAGLGHHHVRVLCASAAAPRPGQGRLGGR